jgi:hypothetical protein
LFGSNILHELEDSFYTLDDVITTVDKYITLQNTVNGTTNVSLCNIHPFRYLVNQGYLTINDLYEHYEFNTELSKDSYSIFTLETALYCFQFDMESVLVASGNNFDPILNLIIQENEFNT